MKSLLIDEAEKKRYIFWKQIKYYFKYRTDCYVLGKVYLTQPSVCQ